MSGYTPMLLGADNFRTDLAGGKASTLHTLTLSGFNVPPGLVILSDINIEHFDDADLDRWVETLGGFPVAVRSSGVYEDLDDASFAGQYESFLDVTDVNLLRKRIDDCRQSAANERVLAYLSNRGLDPGLATVAVLVQKLVNARTAGVGFTIDPLSGIEEHAVIECCQGLGERLVSGHVSPTRLTIRLDDASIVERAEGSEPVQIDAREVSDLVRLMLDIQSFRNRPQDIEWAIDETGMLWLLQSRAITAINWRTDIDQHTDADLRDGGVSARVCTPLMFSLYDNAFQPSMQRFWGSLQLIERTDVRDWMSMYYGRPYWNVSAVKQCYTRVPGYNEEVFDADLGITADYGEKGPRSTPTNLCTIARALPVALALTRAVRRQLVEVDRFADSWPAKYQSWRGRIARFDRTGDREFILDLVDCLRTFHPQTERAYFATIYHNSIVQSDFKTLIGKINAATGQTTAVVDLLGGLAEISHMAMQQGIVDLHRVAVSQGMDGTPWRNVLAQFLHKHGFHAAAELDITCPRWSENPAEVQAMIATIIQAGLAPADPRVSLADQRTRFSNELESVRARLRANPFLRVRFQRTFDKSVSQARAYLVARERMREFSSQAYEIVRSFVVEAGVRLADDGKLPDPNDVFMLSLDELAELAQGRRGSAELIPSIAFRRKMYEGYRDVSPPHELGGATIATPANPDGLVGLGCSPGVVEGTARVIDSLSDIGQLRTGDILITRFTDPGWTPVLGLVTGVVTEVGGMLSHAAVIGREYGIPAVLNVSQATQRIRSGQSIRVDGSSGQVTILETTRCPLAQ